MSFVWRHTVASVLLVSLLSLAGVAALSVSEKKLLAQIE